MDDVGVRDSDRLPLAVPDTDTLCVADGVWLWDWNCEIDCDDVELEAIDTDAEGVSDG